MRDSWTNFCRRSALELGEDGFGGWIWRGGPFGSFSLAEFGCPDSLGFRRHSLNASYAPAQNKDAAPINKACLNICIGSNDKLNCFTAGFDAGRCRHQRAHQSAYCSYANKRKGAIVSVEQKFDALPFPVTGACRLRRTHGVCQGDNENTVKEWPCPKNRIALPWIETVEEIEELEFPDNPGCLFCALVLDVSGPIITSAVYRSNW